MPDASISPLARRVISITLPSAISRAESDRRYRWPRIPFRISGASARRGHGAMASATADAPPRAATQVEERLRRRLYFHLITCLCPNLKGGLCQPVEVISPLQPGFSASLGPASLPRFFERSRVSAHCLLSCRRLMPSMNDCALSRHCRRNFTPRRFQPAAGSAMGYRRAEARDELPATQAIYITACVAD